MENLWKSIKYKFKSIANRKVYQKSGFVQYYDNLKWIFSEIEIVLRKNIIKNGYKNEAEAILK